MGKTATSAPFLCNGPTRWPGRACGTNLRGKGAVDLGMRTGNWNTRTISVAFRACAGTRERFGRRSAGEPVRTWQGVGYPLSCALREGRDATGFGGRGRARPLYRSAELGLRLQFRCGLLCPRPGPVSLAFRQLICSSGVFPAEVCQDYPRYLRRQSQPVHLRTPVEKANLPHEQRDSKRRCKSA